MPRYLNQLKLRTMETSKIEKKVKRIVYQTGAALCGVIAMVFRVATLPASLISAGLTAMALSANSTANRLIGKDND